MKIILGVKLKKDGACMDCPLGHDVPKGIWCAGHDKINPDAEDKPPPEWCPLRGEDGSVTVIPEFTIV